MSRFVPYLALLMGCSVNVHSQSTGTIRGAVSLEADQSRLHHATVSIVQLRRSIQTGQDGTYEFRDVPAGQYDLIAHMHALTDRKQTVQVTAGSTIEANFLLSLGTVRQEITVTASGRQETTLETFQTVTSLDGPQLAIRNAAPSLGELLDHETGIAKRSFGPGSSRPVVRGFDGDRVLVLQDGTRTGTLSSQSGDHGEPVDGAALERVEVVRGPATLLYGSNAIGGVVNVITRHHEIDNHPHPGLRAHVSGLTGSANGLAGSNAGFEYGFGDYLIWANGGGQRSGNYKTPIGTIDNSGAFMTQTSAGFGRHAEKGFFSFSYGLQDGRYGVPPFELGPHDEEDGEEEHHDHEHVKIDWRRHNTRFHGGWRELSGPIESFRATINYSDWKHSEIEDTEIGTRFSNKQFTYRGVFDQQRSGRLSGSFGLWGLHRAFKAEGEEALAPPVNQKAFALFGLEEVRFERIRVQFGARMEHNSYDPDELRSRSFTGLSGSAGVFVPTWTNGAVVLNYTTSYRAPALEELYNFGPHLGNLTFELGNPNLERERGRGLELSVRHGSNRVRAEMTGFYNRLSDFVYLAPTSGEQDGLIEAEYAQSDARYLGAEARLDIGMARDLWLNLGFDIVDAQLRRSRVPLPRIPPVRGRIGLDFRQGSFTFRPELVLSNRQFQIFPTETETAGYAVANVTGTYIIATQHVSHMFGVSVFNVGDRMYRNHLSFIKEFAPEIGRGIRFTYTMNFY